MSKKQFRNSHSESFNKTLRISLTMEILAANLGIISTFAKDALEADNETEFLQQLHEQLTVHDPESTRRKLGDKISDQLLAMFSE